MLPTRSLFFPFVRSRYTQDFHSSTKSPLSPRSYAFCPPPRSTPEKLNAWGSFGYPVPKPPRLLSPEGHFPVKRPLPPNLYPLTGGLFSAVPFFPYQPFFSFSLHDPPPGPRVCEDLKNFSVSSLVPFSPPVPWCVLLAPFPFACSLRSNLSWCCQFIPRIIDILKHFRLSSSK